MMYGDQEGRSLLLKNQVAGAGGLTLYLCAAFQSLSQLVWKYPTGLLWGCYGCLYRLSLGKSART